ncbi:hypothetical protein [Planctomycetes bacterium Poly30]|uniref:hypothetical protein n=1 Tax=Saltatorellus ferox TaxID=2528018 RepID=UPI0011A39DF6
MMMFPSTLITSLLLAAATTDPVTVLPAQSEGDSQLVSRTFDLSAFQLTALNGALMARPVRMLPLTRGMMGPGTSSWYDGDRVESDSPSELLVSTFLTSGEADVQTVELSEDDMLYLEAPAETVAEFEQLQSTLAKQFLVGPRLQISRFVGRGDLPPELRRGGVIPRALLERWTAEHVLSAGPSGEGVRTVSLPGGRIQVVADLESHSVVSRVDAQVAEGTAGLEAQVGEAAVGSEVTLSGYRVGEGVQLSYLAMESARHDRDVGDSVSAELILTSEAGRTHTDDSARWTETFGVTGGAVAGEAHLKADQVLILSVGAADGDTFFVVISLDPSSMGGSATLVGARPNLNSSCWLVAPRGWIRPTVIGVNWENVEFPRTLEVDAREVLSGSSTLLEVQFEERSRSMFGRLLETVNIQDELDFGGATMVLYEPEAEEAVARFAAAEATRTHANLQVALSGRDHAGSDSHLGSLTIQNGGVGAIVSGRELLLAKQLSTEVAQRARVQMPWILTHFEGLVLTMKMVRVPGGQLAYQLKGQLSTDLSIDEGSVNEVAGRGLLAVHAGHLVIDERGLVQADADGNWTILVGNRDGAHVELAVRQD